MGRLIVIASLLGMMWVVQALQASSLGSQDPLTLASIGFVLLASYATAELGSVLTLPRVTGFIIAGVVAGPSLANILSERVVGEMTMFNTLALGLIATGAGLEMDVAAIRKVSKTLFSTIIAKIILAGGAVAGTFYVVQQRFELLDILPGSETLVVGMVLGALAIGTSPAIVLAVISETKARGRIADLVMAAAVFKDVVLVVLLALVLSISKNLLAPDSSHGSLAQTLAVELGGSLLAGSVLGGIIIAYVRFIRVEMLLFVAAMVLAVAAAGKALHLDLLLVFIVAGFVVRTFSTKWHDVVHALETVSLPVFVVFFTIAGARLDLQTTLVLAPAAGLLVLVRAGAFVASSHIGGAIGGESASVRWRSAIAYLPQAGVTLGLLGLAAEALPGVGKEMGDLGLAVVAINLLIGPVALRLGLSSGAADDSSEVALEAGESTADSGIPVVDETTKAPAKPRFASGNPELDRLGRRAMAEFEGKLGLIDGLTESLSQRYLHGPLRAVMKGCAEDTDPLVFELFAEPSNTRAREYFAELSEEIRQALVSLEDWIERQDAVLVVPMIWSELSWESSDTRATKVRKVLRRVFWLLPGQRQRLIPVRTVLRLVFVSRIASGAQQSVRGQVTSYLKTVAAMQQFADDRQELDVAVETEKAEAERREEARAIDQTALANSAAAELEAILLCAGSPQRPMSTIRFSNSAEAIEKSLEEVLRASPRYLAVVEGAHESVSMSFLVHRAADSVSELIDERALAPLSTVVEAYETMVSEVTRRLGAAQSLVGSTKELKQTIEAISHSFSEVRQEREALFQTGSVAFRPGSIARSLQSDLRSALETFPKVARVTTSPLTSGRPEQVSVRVIEPRAQALLALRDGLSQGLDRELQQSGAVLQDLDARIVDALEAAFASVEALSDAGSEPEVAINRLNDAEKLLSRAGEEAQSDFIASHDRLEVHIAQTKAMFEAILAPTERTQMVVGGARLAARQRQITMFFARKFEQSKTTFHALRERLRNRFASRRHKQAKHQALAGSLSWVTEVDVPPSYARHFSHEPVRTSRLLVGYDRPLSALVACEADWTQRGIPGSLLVVGERQSGRTSLLAIAEQRWQARRIIKPDALRQRRRKGIHRALAFELRCRRDIDAIADRLRDSGAVIVVDDLEHWLPAGVGALAELRSFMRLVAATRDRVLWIVTTNRSFEANADDVVSLRSAFNERIVLPSLSATDLRRMIESRHNATGVALAEPKGRWFRLGSLVYPPIAHQAIFRALWRASGGVPGTALVLWLRCLVHEAERVRPDLSFLLACARPPLDTAGVVSAAVIDFLLQYGPQRAEELMNGLAIERELIDQALFGLAHHRLVECDRQQTWALVPQWSAIAGGALEPAFDSILRSDDGARSRLGLAA